MASLRFVCCWTGVKYGVEYVEHLRDGIHRHHPGAKIWCLTDRPSEVPDKVAAVDVSKHGLDGWWNKLLLFKRGVLPKGDYLYLDLDMIVVGEFHKPTGFWVMQDLTGGCNSSAMSFHTEEVSGIWDHFSRNPQRFMRDLRGDQDFVNVHFRGQPLQFFPPSWFPVWKRHQDRISADTVAWVLHGRPKPHQISPHDRSIWTMTTEPIKINLAEIPTIGIGRHATHLIEPVMTEPYWKGCAASHALAATKALEYDGPVLILESDATARKGASERFVIPAETDAVYCGLSQWGHSGRRSAWRDTRNRDLVRIINMLASHAILLVSRRFKEQYRMWSTHPQEPFDIELARNQPRYNVFGLKNPPYYQGPDSNKNARATNWVIR